jgi:UDP-N-acetylglucosamine--N-acetylmuramyl-(pentapeptide) pyrophosphoryl-undecaprenol N-acetylglucosamine transferase
MAGGGTGGHVVPLIAVARDLRRRGHTAVFIGTRTGMEARLAPKEDFPIEYIEIGGLKRVGWKKTLRTLVQLPLSVWRVAGILRRLKPGAVFSLGGYVAGPVAIAAWLLRIPIVLMEPNAMPGMTNRRMARFARRALLSFPEASPYFDPAKVSMTGLPVRAEFFDLKPKPREEKLTVLVTGGSRGSQRLNEAARASWPLFARERFAVRWIHQTGLAEYDKVREAFAAAGPEGVVAPFLDDMPGAFAQSDLVVCRSGAGAVAELAAAGKPSILVPYPYAADDHQLRNAEAMERAGAAKLIRDGELNGGTLFEAVSSLAREPGRLARMGECARTLAKPGAAARAVQILEEEAERG